MLSTLGGLLPLLKRRLWLRSRLQPRLFPCQSSHLHQRQSLHRCLFQLQHLAVGSIRHHGIVTGRRRRGPPFRLQYLWQVVPVRNDTDVPMHNMDMLATQCTSTHRIGAALNIAGKNSKSIMEADSVDHAEPLYSRKLLNYPLMRS